MNESQGNAQAGDSLQKSLLQVNKMLYAMPPSLGITARRHHVIDFSQQQTYTNGQTAVFDLQTGSYMVDGKNSYLRLNLAVAGGDGGFRSGGITNIIKRIVVRTKSGKEWCRCEEYNLYIRNYLRYKCPNDWFTTTASASGYVASATDYADVTTASGKNLFTMPLWMIPCFNQDKLLPSQILEGLRIEITLASPEEAFLGGTVTGYTVTDMEIHSDAYDIADQFKRKVAEMSARQGLVLVHKEYFHSNVGTSGATTQYNFDVKKACSKACRSFTVLRKTADVTTNAATNDVLQPEQYTVTRYQAHVGQDYMPNQPIAIDAVPSATNIAEAYTDTQFVFDKLNQCWNPNNVSKTNFLGGSSATVLNNGLVAFNLNKSHVTDLDGYVLNNSRALVIDIQTNGSSQDRKVDTYLEHLRVAKVYTANAEIRD
jgi:hypothetical protein